jgi:hypothetical protein
MRPLRIWTRMALINLAIVAFLGLSLRGKIVFFMPFIDFKYLMHAHSHFAFGGWVTLVLLALMTYRILPESMYRKPVYQWLLGGIVVNAYGMLLSFPFQGYGFYSILFSTLFIFVTYGYTFVFVRDILRTAVSGPVKALATGAVSYMALSSVGAFTLAGLLATKSKNIILYKDAIYTYLHLQYNGFFTLALFAIILHYLKASDRRTRLFALLLNVSVIPSMFISYLWHHPHPATETIAIVGSMLAGAAAIVFLSAMYLNKGLYTALKPVARGVLSIAMAAFVLKMIFQALTIIPSLGALVFYNRPVIIGFLHLVLLGFVTLGLLSFFVQTGLLDSRRRSRFGLWLFVGGVVLNELVLFLQGLGFMLMLSSAISNWLLLTAAAILFTGALLMALHRPEEQSLNSFS